MGSSQVPAWAKAPNLCVPAQLTAFAGRRLQGVHIPLPQSPSFSLCPNFSKLEVGVHRTAAGGVQELALAVLLLVGLFPVPPCVTLLVVAGNGFVMQCM